MNRRNALATVVLWMLTLPASASVLRIEFNGVLDGFGGFFGDGNASIFTKNVTYPAFSPIMNEPFTEILVPAGTAVSGSFTIDLNKLPAPAVVNPYTDGPTQISPSPRHSSIAPEPWIVGQWDVAGFSFTTQLDPIHDDPRAANGNPTQFSQEIPKSYTGGLGYGADNFGSADFPAIQEGFVASADTQTSYGFTNPTNPDHLSGFSFHSYSMSMQLQRQLLFGGPSFLGDPFSLPMSFDWDDGSPDPLASVFNFGILQMAYGAVDFRSALVEGEDGNLVEMFTESQLFGSFTARLTSVRAFTIEPASVTEPGTATLACTVLCILLLLRRRRNDLHR